VTGQATWYADADGDTFGDAAASQLSCVQPADHVANDTDCNDDDPNNWTSCAVCVDGDKDTWYVRCDAYVTINGPDCFDDDSANFPGNAEICDGQDNDCDLAVDDADPDVTGQATWYADMDGDGFGDAAATRVACSQPLGYVADGTDCDDGEGDTYPGAPEVCDGMDNQCPGDPGFGEIDEGHDSDGDTLPDCFDPDDDNDGVLDDEDCAPLVNSVSGTPEGIGNLFLGPGASRLEWLNTASANVFNVYRGSWIGAAGFTYNHTCLEQEVADTEYTDPVIPQPGETIYYLVSGRNSCPAGEGSLGLDSSDLDRPNDAPCPTAGTADTDNDQVPDINDNCPLEPNSGQSDGDHDGVGDPCDNCPFDYDPTQLDTDGDGTGDICE
jgi:hypothetical protein